jgi:small-conductance mechanosensitive channel/CRP-like cAMP-binding protein
MPFWDTPLRFLLPFALAVVLVATLFRLVKSAPRERLRRSVILFGLYAAVAGVTFALGDSGGKSLVAGLRIAGKLLELLLLINLVALLVFDLTFRAFRVRYADILHDLAVGAAYVFALFWLMADSGVNLTSIVATSAVVTAVIGLSLQSTLGNVIGGLALQVDDSIRDGDWVELENKMQGQVKKVRWRHTVIDTRDHDTLIVPNSQLLSQTIKILGRRDGMTSHHRMWVYFNVDHRFSPGEVIRVVNQALQAAPIEGVASEPPAHTVCVDLARDGRDSYFYYAARYFLLDLARDDPTNSAVRERIYAALRRAGIPFALPAATRFVANEDSERRERKRAEQRQAQRQALRGVELFAQLSSEELERLADTATLVPFAPGEIVTRQGAQAHWLYVLVEGEVDVRVATPDGGARLVTTLHAPSFFGEMALMTGAPREATVVARGDVSCLRVDKGDFQALVARRPEIAQEVSALLAERRVGLLSVREGLDDEAKSRRVESEKSRLLSSIRGFFGLDG